MQTPPPLHNASRDYFIQCVVVVSRGGAELSLSRFQCVVVARATISVWYEVYPVESLSHDSHLCRVIRAYNDAIDAAWSSGSSLGS